MDDRLIHPDKEGFAGRTNRWKWSAFMDDGVTPKQLGPSDVVRFKISLTEGGTPVIDIKLGTTTANGSTVTIDSGLTFGYVVLGPLDTANLAGWFFDEVDYVDNADGQIKPIVRGKIYFHKSQGGNTGP